ncbi:MAG: phosphatidate cytidylyltransferase [Alphaproteobacteria bacterium]|nr:phosphatidate cytidylyltransferase [Alphaproteobacteria bacterium]
MTKKLKNNLTLRLTSAAILIPLVLAVIWVGDQFYIYKAVVFAAMMLAMAEWMKLTAPKITPRGKSWNYVGLAAILIVALLKDEQTAALLTPLAALISGFYAYRTKGKKPFWAAFGMLYLGLCGLSLFYLRAHQDGFFLMLYLVLVVWATDSGAFVAGKTIKGPKLLPQISPQKTWAGLAGGMICAALLGGAVAHFFGKPYPCALAGLGAILAVMAQSGDFLESFLKRQARVKDSGTLIPGHGGLLDRIDGLLAASLFLAAGVFLSQILPV